MIERIQKLESQVSELSRNIQKLSPKEEEITGVTGSSANTQKTFSHGLKKKPSGFKHVTGDVYVFDMNELQVDVRSTQTSQNFKIIIS